MPDAFAFSPDGRWLASTSSRDNGVTLWQVATGQAVRTFEEHGQYENPHYAGEIAFTPDGDWLVWSDLSGICTLWEVGTGRKVGKIEGLARRGRFSRFQHGRKVVGCRSLYKALPLAAAGLMPLQMSPAALSWCGATINWTRRLPGGMIVLGPAPVTDPAIL